MHIRRIAPEAEQCTFAGREAFDRFHPAFLAYAGTRPGPMALYLFVVRDRVEQSHDRYPSSRATFSKPVTSAGGR